ncbi:MAG: hypothetical protein U0791_26555 [Gemmataceae bacterium]
MPDNLQHVQPGAPFEPSAATWNEFIDAARAVKDHRSQRGENALNALIQPHNTCLVKYDASTGSTLAAFSTLSYGTPLIDPSAAASDRLLASKRPAIAGVTPSAATANRPFLITMEPIQGGSLGRAVASGLAVVQVSVSSASHWRAKPSAGVTANLVSTTSGGVPILWKESGTGTKWAMVLLDFGGDSRSADCTRITATIRAGGCFTLTRPTAGVGSGSCVPDPGSIALTWDDTEKAAIGDADTPIYGCPPGVVTELCASGAPKKWKFAFAGFTGDVASWNGTYTLSYSSGETWTVTKNGLTLTATQIAAGNWQLTADDGTYLASWTAEGVSGCCTAITLSLGDDGGATGAPSTLTLQPVTACGKGKAYIPWLDLCEGTCEGPKPRLRLVPQGGTGSRTITCTLLGCGEDANGGAYLEFHTDDPAIATGEVQKCGENGVTFRVTCRCCPGENPNYFGPGWYKMQSGTCLYLTEDPATGTLPCSDVATAICSGPWETEPEDCTGPCEITIPGCDCAVTLPGRLCVAVAMTATGSTGLDDYGLGGRSFPVTYDPSSGTWKWRSAAGMVLKVHDYGLGGSGYFLQVLLKEVTFSLSCGSVGISLSGNLHSTDPNYPNESSWAAGVTATYVDDNSEFTSPACLTGALLPTNLACCVIGKTVSGAATPLPGPLNSGMATNPTYSYTVDLATLGGDCDPGGEDAYGTSYNCLGDGSCIDPGDGTGTYATLAECIAACVGGGGGGGGSGPATDCGKNGTSPSDSMVITGGTAAGTFPGTWHTGSPNYETFYPTGFSGGVVLEFFSGQWHLVWVEGGTIHDITATSGTCSPFTLTFTGGPGGATTTVINP